MITFSQLVDRVIQETARQSLLALAARFLNQTIREVHTNERGQPVAFQRNLVEAQLVADVDTGFEWVAPVLLQQHPIVRYDSVVSTEGPVYPEILMPSRIMNFKDHFFYQSGDRYIFSGYGGENGIISLAYYLFPSRLNYFPVGERPGEFDDAGVFVVNPDFTGTEEEARAQTVNWLLEKWEDVLAEGVLAKLYKAQGEDEANGRARSAFSAFERQRLQLHQIEAGLDSSGV